MADLTTKVQKAGMGGLLEYARLSIGINPSQPAENRSNNDQGLLGDKNQEELKLPQDEIDQALEVMEDS